MSHLDPSRQMPMSRLGLVTLGLTSRLEPSELMFRSRAPTSRVLPWLSQLKLATIGTRFLQSLYICIRGDTGASI